jgi:hypothetical protein|tara:strand:- start:119 stop:268 length:150 start_codon:yes stop_codon:yes gene_type:complete
MGWGMKLSLIVLFFVSLILIGGLIFLAVWDIPAPVSTIEREISDANHSQ